MSSLLGSGLFFGFLCTSSGVTSGSPCDSGIRVGVNLLHVGGDLLELVGGDRDSLGENLTGDLVGGGGRLDLLGGGVADESLLGLAFSSGEEDELGLVGVESLNVELELLLAGGGSSVVNRDADGTGEGGAQTGVLELDESEATAISDLTGVLARARGDDGSQLLDGHGEHSLGLTLSL